MKKILLALLIGSTAWSNAQELPAASPAATIVQRVGLTDVEIKYSRPSVKGRAIFGDLVPFDEMWRTGANASTKISFSTDVQINGTNIVAGTYSFYTIPGKEMWTIILNNNLTHWGVGGYSEKEDAVRLEVKPTALTNKVENMRFSVENITDNGADIVLAWNDMSVALPIAVNVKIQSKTNIDKALGDAHLAYRNAANYYADEGDFEMAMKHIDMAISMSSSWYTRWIKAEILAKSGDFKKALKQGEEAIKVGDEYYSSKKREFTYKAGLEESMSEWKAKK